MFDVLEQILAIFRRQLSQHNELCQTIWIELLDEFSTNYEVDSESDIGVEC